jgi:hypothetical protein
MKSNYVNNARPAALLEPRRTRTALEMAAKAVPDAGMFSAGKRIALYLSFDRETDTSRPDRRGAPPRRARFRAGGRRPRHGRIRFYPLDGKTRQANSGSRAQTHAARAASMVDLIVIPLVGVDGAGRRLGWAAGSMTARWSSAAAASLARTALGRARLRLSADRIEIRGTLGHAPGFPGDGIGTAALLERE